MRFRTLHLNRLVDTGDFMLTAAVVFFAIATIVSAYGGYADPSVFPAAALVAMTFPGFVLATVVILAVMLFVRRRLAIVAALALLAAGPALFNYCPLRFGHDPTPAEEPRAFTVMTYNALGFTDYTGQGLDAAEPNRTVRMILEQDPDILCLQESVSLVPDEARGISTEMAVEFYTRYPYMVRSGHSALVLYSKFPVTRLVADQNMSATADYVGYRLNVRGRLLTIYNMHLQSIGLSPDDKALYHQLTDAKTSVNEMARVPAALFAKLYAAFNERAKQARFIRELVESRGGNVIVCGDFNDIPGSYAVRTVKGHDMHDAFADAGTGPSVTYRAGRFYFRIDHMLYRGDFHAINCERLRDGLSDHYPLMATFVWDTPSIVEQNSMPAAGDDAAAPLVPAQPND